MLGSVPLDSSALTLEKWQGHCTVQMAYLCTQRILGFPQWRQCIALMLHPWQFAKNPLSGPSQRKILFWLGFLWLCVFGEVDRSLSWFWHLSYKSQCKSAGLHLSCSLSQPHYTMALARMDGTQFQHILHVCMDIIHHQRGNSSELLLEAFIGTNPDLMFC